MNKIAEFYNKVMSGEALKEKFTAIVGNVAPDKLSDEALGKLAELAKEAGFEITVAEAKEYFKPVEGEISDDDLDKVAGGKGEGFSTDDRSVICGDSSISIVVTRGENQ